MRIRVCRLSLNKLEKKKEKSWWTKNAAPQRPECAAQLKSQFRCGVHTATHECVVRPCRGLPLGAEWVFAAGASPRGSRKSSLCGIWKDEPGPWGVSKLW